MFAPEAAQLWRALFPAADPTTLGPAQRAGEFSAELWRIYRGGRTCFHRALHASARDIGTVYGHARRDPLPGCDHSLMDKSTPHSTQVGLPNVLSGEAAARRGLFSLLCPNTQSLCLWLYGYNQVGRH